MEEDETHFTYVLKITHFCCCNNVAIYFGKAVIEMRSLIEIFNQLMTDKPIHRVVKANAH
jgi:hypothetical protein